MITVISTGFAHKTKDACIASVRTQQGVLFEHVYVEASEQKTPKGALENFYDVAMQLPPDRVIACLDGDDRLLHDHALWVVERLYEEKPETLVTFGQYCTFDQFGRYFEGRCSAYPRPSYRDDVWRASHLKTFRAGMFQKIKKADLMWEGQFAPFTCDQIVMFPILEMAGPERTIFNPDPIYVYNTDHTQVMMKNGAEMRLANAIERAARAAPPYERIDAL